MTITWFERTAPGLYQPKEAWNYTAAWLTTPADPHWDPICDLAVPYDDLIDTRDLDVLLHNWLKSNCKSNN